MTRHLNGGGKKKKEGLSQAMAIRGLAEALGGKCEKEEKGGRGAQGGKKFLGVQKHSKGLGKALKKAAQGDRREPTKT